jgi:uncharacterized membrane protein
MSKYSKAIAAVVGAVAAVAIVFNVDISEETQAVIISVATGLVTLLAPKNAE